MSAENGSPNDGAGPVATRAPEAHDEGLSAALKRKASTSPLPPDDGAAQSPKRTKLEGESTTAAREEEPATTAEGEPATTAEDGPATTARGEEPATKAREEPPSADSAPAPAPTPQAPDRRKSTQEEERKRSRRLFGGLLNTLSQSTTSSSAHKRRPDVERRQQTQVHQRRAENDQRREEKLAKLQAVRKREQLKFDEQVMQRRHADMLAKARFLQTSAEPKIFYLPWDLTPEQEDATKDQIRDAKEAIEIEAREFKQQKKQRMKALGIPIPSSPSPAPEPAPEPEHAPEPEPEPEPEQAPVPEPEHAPEPKPAPEDEAEAKATVGNRDAAPPEQPPVTESEPTNPVSVQTPEGDGHERDEEAGDVLVEDEDTVIY